MISIDGSYGEGGGQIIRTCLTLAAITGKEFEITNIRAGRSKPGLQPQHLASVNATATICAAVTEGAAKGSQRLLFRPTSPVLAGDYQFDIGTAGATALVFQTILLPLCLAGDGSSPTITGGTHVPHAPPIEFLEYVYLPAIERAGYGGHVAYDLAGFYPRGGGELWAWIGASPPQSPITMSERGELCALKAFIVTSGLPDHVSERGSATVEKFMKGVGRRIEVERRDKESPGQGAAVIITAVCDGGLAGFTSIGERGKPMERVGEEPCEQFMKWWKSGAACDERLADQLVLPASLMSGESRWTTPRVSEHLTTVLWAVKQFISIEFELAPGPGDSTMVILRGAPTDEAQSKFTAN